GHAQPPDLRRQQPRNLRLTPSPGSASQEAAMSTDNPAIPRPFPDALPGGLLSHRSNGLAFAEGALLLGGLALLDHTGILPFAAAPIHPFLFAIILLSAQYGLQGGMLAAMGATLL